MYDHISTKFEMTCAFALHARLIIEILINIIGSTCLLRINYVCLRHIIYFHIMYIQSRTKVHKQSLVKCLENVYIYSSLLRGYITIPIYCIKFEKSADRNII